MGKRRYKFSEVHRVHSASVNLVHLNTDKMHDGGIDECQSGVAQLTEGHMMSDKQSDTSLENESLFIQEQWLE